MAVNLTAAINAESTNAPIPLRAGLACEFWTVTGAASAINDTGTLVPKFLTTIVAVIGGPVVRSISGSTITLTDKSGIGTTVFDVQVIGR